jgi:hypothetical protein
MKQHALARNLANTSLLLGMAELLAPRQVARLIGVDERHQNTLRLLGLREIASGLGIMQANPAYFLWSRVAGDIMDLALLGAAARHSTNPRRTQVAVGVVVGVTIMDVIASALHSRSYADPEWRDPRPIGSRRSMPRQDPAESRRHADATMRAYTAADSNEETAAQQADLLPGAGCESPAASSQRTT